MVAHDGHEALEDHRLSACPLGHLLVHGAYIVVHRVVEGPGLVVPLLLDQLPHSQVVLGIDVQCRLDVPVAAELGASHRIGAVVDDIEDVDELGHVLVDALRRASPLDGDHVVDVRHAQECVRLDAAPRHPMRVVDHDADVGRVGHVVEVVVHVLLRRYVVDGRRQLNGNRAQVLGLLGLVYGPAGVLVVDAEHDGHSAPGRIDCRAQQRGPLRLTEHRAFPERRCNLYGPLTVADPAVYHHLHHLVHGAQVDLQVLVERRRYRPDRPHYEFPQPFSVHGSSTRSRYSRAPKCMCPPSRYQPIGEELPPVNWHPRAYIAAWETQEWEIEINMSGVVVSCSRPLLPLRPPRPLR